MTEDPYVKVNQIAHKYTHTPEEFVSMLDDLRDLMLLTRLQVCLKINSHVIYPDSQIANIRRILENAGKHAATKR